MRILHVNKSYHEHDGVGRSMFGLMKLQEEAGHIVAPLAMHDPRSAPSPWSEYFVSLLDTRRAVIGLNAVKQFSQALWSREAETKMTKMLDVFQPDIVHAHNIYTHLSPSVLEPCRQRGIPVVLTAHDYGLVSANYLSPDPSWWHAVRSRSIKGSFLATLVLETITRWQFSRRLYDRSISRYIAVSQFVKDALINRGYDEGKIDAVYSFAPPFLDGGVGQERETSQRAVSTPYLLFAGRIETYKGIGTFIEAAKKLPSLQFVIAGQGPDEERYKKASTKLPNVTWRSFVSGQALWTLMSEATAVIVPSLWDEPFGLVALEAMACESVPIVSRKGGLPEIVEEGVSGLVFRAGQAGELVDRIAELFKSPKGLETMRQEALKRAQEIGDPQAYLEAVLDVYSKAMAE